jgi:methanogenic corrinoid protein MtbC1
MSITRQIIDALAEWNSCEDRVQRHKEPRAQRSQRFLADEGGQNSILARTIEGEVIPRLMLAHRVTAPVDEPSQRAVVSASPEDIAELARLVLEHDTAVALAFVDALRNRGLEVEVIYIELLAPTASLLGEMWKADLCDFTDVTMGLSRLQQIVLQMGAETEDHHVHCSNLLEAPRILLVPMLGEQHTLGLMLVEEQFRRCGWECSSAAPRSEKDLLRMVKSQHYDVIGISASCDVLLDPVTSVIQDVRKASKNSGAIVLVGGGIFIDNPQYVSLVGADGTAEDGRQAAAELRRLLETRLKSS